MLGKKGVPVALSARDTNINRSNGLLNGNCFVEKGVLLFFIAVESRNL